MFAALGKFWSALFTVFDTVERASNSINEIAQIAEAEASGLKDQMQVERDDRHDKLVKRLKIA
ncbi:MAG: hypothetical protein V7746_02835 [Halioglobus sp.]|jgi:hypothetical protein